MKSKSSKLTKIVTFIISVIIISSLISYLSNQSLKTQIAALNNQVNNLMTQNGDLNLENYNLSKQIDELKSNTSSSDLASDSSSIYVSTYTFSNGTYEVGVDINPGAYNLTALSGYGLIKGDLKSGFISMGFGIDESMPDDKTYSGMKLSNGDEFTISNGVTIEFKKR